MNWKIEKAKNNQFTVKLNNIYIYSKYNPKFEVERFMQKEVNVMKKKFIVVGLGLGYHIEFLVHNIENVEVQYILLDSKEEELFRKYGQKEILHNTHINRYNNDVQFMNSAQIIIPNAFLTAIGEKHPLFQFIEDIKIRQLSFTRFKGKMEANFNGNIKLYRPLTKCIPKHTKAALIASGPSLNQTIQWLSDHQDEFDIYCVGSALKYALDKKIIPLAVMISDAQDNISTQIDERFNNQLLFLSTANHQAILKHRGEKQILFQKGYSLAEEWAKKHQQPLFETGGSVATTAFSYIEWLGYKQLYLFGQDLGFAENRTHAQYSTSGRIVNDSANLLEVESNDGSIIHTTPNLMAYKRWFDQSIMNTKMAVFNTASKGAKLANTSFIDILHQ